MSAGAPLYPVTATVVPMDSRPLPARVDARLGASKLHWRDLGPQAQRQSLARIAELDTRKLPPASHRPMPWRLREPMGTDKLVAGLRADGDGMSRIEL